MSLAGRISLSRTALVPTTSVDAEKLSKMGIEGLIFPLDEALGLGRQPFKLTVAAMLEIAKESARLGSFSKAGQALKETGMLQVISNTTRRVTNVIGNLVFQNDVRRAEAVFDARQAGRLELPRAKLCHFLCLVVAGDILPIRQETQELDTTYLENRLAMVFSSDNRTCLESSGGIGWEGIIKKEFASLIGDGADFGKLLFAMALRNGYGYYKETVILFDNSAWIRDIKNLFFPEAVLILDFNNFKNIILNFVIQMYKCDKSTCLEWVEQVVDFFKIYGPSEAIKQLKKILKHNNSPEYDNLLEYLHTNKEIIDYHYYLAKGFPICNDAVDCMEEATFTQRLKNWTNRWTLELGQAMSTLAAKLASGLWETDVVEVVYARYGEPLPDPLEGLERFELESSRLSL